MAQQSILITGCSSGIGHHTALLLKKRGYRVFATARKTEDVEKLIAEGLESVQLDVTDSASMERALNAILEKTSGTLGALFNNAGFLTAGAIEDLTPDLERAQFETNVFGPIELTRRVLPIMRKQGHGRIIQNSSILGIITLPYYGAYNASKFALEGFSQSLRQELRGTQIHVSLINPGPIQSSLRKTAHQLYQQSPEVYRDSIHQDVYQQIEKSYFNLSKEDRKLMQGPEAVSKKVIHALESKHPKLHYYVGLPTHLLAIAKRILPDCALDWILARVSYHSKD